MENTSTFKAFTENHKRNRKYVMQVATDLEVCNTYDDYKSVCDKYHAKSINGNWIIFHIPKGERGNVEVELHLKTMVLMGSFGGARATVRYMLDMGAQLYLQRIATELSYSRFCE